MELGYKDCQRPHNAHHASGQYRDIPAWVINGLLIFGCGCLMWAGMIAAFVLDASVVMGGM